MFKEIDSIFYHPILILYRIQLIFNSSIFDFADRNEVLIDARSFTKLYYRIRISPVLNTIYSYHYLHNNLVESHPL